MCSDSGQCCERVGHSVPIGQPIANLGCHVLDAELELVKRYQPPIVSTALGSPKRVLDAVPQQQRDIRIPGILGAAGIFALVATARLMCATGKPWPKPRSPPPAR